MLHMLLAATTIGAFQLPDVELAGTTWHGNPLAAVALARKTDKPLLVLDMFGRLDETFC